MKLASALSMATLHHSSPNGMVIPLTSLKVWIPVYSEPVHKPGNREGGGTRGIQCIKIAGGAWLGLLSCTRLTIALVCVAAAGQLVVIQ